MCCPAGHGNGEGASSTQLAHGADRTAVQFNELLDQGEADAATLEGSALGAFDAVEALEEERQLLRGNARTSVSNREFRRRTVWRRPELDSNLAFEGELE